MPCLAHCAQQCAVASKAVSIAPLVLTWLEHRLKVVEHQQARPISQKLEQDGEPSRGVVRRLAPVLTPLDGPGLSRLHVADRFSPWSRAVSENAVEPHLVQWGVHPRRLSHRRGPQFVYLNCLAPSRESARLEQHQDERLQPLSSRVVGARFPILN